MLKRIVVGGVLQPTSSGEASVSSSNREYERGYLPRYCMSRKGRGYYRTSLGWVRRGERPKNMMITDTVRRGFVMESGGGFDNDHKAN